jgi:hypothetical protein
MTDEQEKRPAPISYRPPKGREAEFVALVSESGLSTNAFLNARVFGRRRPDAGQREQLGLLLVQAAEISDRLQAIALAGAAHSPLEIESAGAELRQIRAALLIMLGRKP